MRLRIGAFACAALMGWLIVTRCCCAAFSTTRSSPPLPPMRERTRIGNAEPAPCTPAIESVSTTVHGSPEVSPASGVTRFEPRP